MAETGTTAVAGVGGDGSQSAPLPIVGITDPTNKDVLCGRGGGFHRHPGNVMYRTLVTVNKKAYITCLKSEKLKISRSIVAAVREERGRFLDKDPRTNTWFDIGDKKAVEKTSQALREGQPKLRRMIIDQQQPSPNDSSTEKEEKKEGDSKPSGTSTGGETTDCELGIRRLEVTSAVSSDSAPPGTSLTLHEKEVAPAPEPPPAPVAAPSTAPEQQESTRVPDLPTVPAFSPFDPVEIRVDFNGEDANNASNVGVDRDREHDILVAQQGQLSEQRQPAPQQQQQLLQQQVLQQQQQQQQQGPAAFPPPSIYPTPPAGDCEFTPPAPVPAPPSRSDITFQPAPPPPPPPPETDFVAASAAGEQVWQQVIRRHSELSQLQQLQQQLRQQEQEERFHNSMPTAMFDSDRLLLEDLSLSSMDVHDDPQQPLAPPPPPPQQQQARDVAFHSSLPVMDLPVMDRSLARQDLVLPALMMNAAGGGGGAASSGPGTTMAVPASKLMGAHDPGALLTTSQRNLFASPPQPLPSEPRNGVGGTNEEVVLPALNTAGSGVGDTGRRAGGGGGGGGGTGSGGVVPESQVSLMSDFSMLSLVQNNSIMSMDASVAQQTVVGGFGNNKRGLETPTGSQRIVGGAGAGVAAEGETCHGGGQARPSTDLRRTFAMSKYRRPPSAANRSVATRATATTTTEMSLQSLRENGCGPTEAPLPDDMPEVCVVGSNMTIQSNFSNITGVESSNRTMTMTTAKGQSHPSGGGMGIGGLGRQIWEESAGPEGSVDNSSMGILSVQSSFSGISSVGGGGSLGSHQRKWRPPPTLTEE